MKRIYAFYFYRTATYVHDLRVMQAGVKVTPETLSILVLGAAALNDFQTQVDPTRLRSSIAAAITLEGIVRKCLQTIADNTTRHKQVSVFSDQTQEAAREALHYFETMLSKELDDFPLFSVEDKGDLSLQVLLDGTSKRCEQRVRGKLTPRIEEEIDESGKCLAYGRSTASAFHMFRAIELLIQQYIKALGLSMPPLSRCNWGEYIAILRKGKAPDQTTDLLQIIKDNYRNPIMHPDDTLAEPDAISLFRIGQSTIEILARHIP